MTGTVVPDPAAAMGCERGPPSLPPALELRDVTVCFGALVADRHVDLRVEKGAIHAIVGENGAGKTTLMRAAFGLVPMATGEVLVDGERLSRPSPGEAIRRGLGMVHQHFMLVETLTAAENIVLGREPAGRLTGWLDRRLAEANVAMLARRHRLMIEPHRLTGDLSVGEQQRLEILKALYRGARVLILDEPTAVLTPPEVDELFVVLRTLVAGGGTVLLVTHKLDEVMAVSSHVTVLHRGRIVATHRTKEVTAAEIAREMVGRELKDEPTHAARAPGEVLLRVEDLRTEEAGRSASQQLQGVSLEVRAGEIVGIAGVEGNGQSALVDALTGLAPRASLRAGCIRLGGRDVTRASPGERRRLGLGHVPEDRLRRGLIPELTLADNLLLGREHEFAWFGWGPIRRGRLESDARRLLEEQDVRPPEPRQLASALSGGNQQKLVLARELAMRPRVLIASQPTRGVDVGAIERIHAALERLRLDGRGVLLLSAELDELLALADRILVLLRGRIVAALARRQASRECLGALMTAATPAGLEGISPTGGVRTEGQS